MEFRDNFFERLDNYTSSPFLFIGSGFSFKYIQSERWEGLLRKYSDEIGTPFEKYKSLANSHWPQVGSLIAKDYHSYWFDNPEMNKTMLINKHHMVDVASPLKVAVSNYLKDVSTRVFDEELMTDVELLLSSKIGGVITTNYDLLCERLFPSFKVYKSQKELILSPITEIGEIYKIHGCCTSPNSLIITKEDYEDFIEKNAYLAAKLITVFLEHPTIFIGYSISDENVRRILASIIKCLDRAQINELAERLFFVEYIHDHKDEPIIDKYEFEIGGSILPLTRIRTKEYTQILQVLTALNQKFPASLLRKMKEHIYELVNTNDPSGKIAVVDFDADTDLNKVDVVIGVGVAGKNDKSYETFSRYDIAEDIVFDNKEFDHAELVAKTLPKLAKASQWIPVWKYIKAIQDKSKLDSRINSIANRPIDEWRQKNPYHYKEKRINEDNESLKELIEYDSPDKVLKMILLLDLSKIDLDILKKFLQDNINLNNGQNSSYYMKLICLYDRLRNSQI